MSKKFINMTFINWEFLCHKSGQIIPMNSPIEAPIIKANTELLETIINPNSASELAAIIQKDFSINTLLHFAKCIPCIFVPKISSVYLQKNVNCGVRS